MARKVNKNFLHLRKSLNQGSRGAVLQGSSRSGKTFSGIDFIIYLCTRVEQKCTINIIRETYNSFKTTLYEDFNRRLPAFDIKSPFENIQEKPSFYINDCKINLIGADKPSKAHGASCDYAFFNECMYISEPFFNQTEMRCRKFWWMDYNPEYWTHWIYERVLQRPDVTFLKTTYKDNSFISKAEKNKIESYEPTSENIANGTADEFMWRIYGLGEKSLREGSIYTHWKQADYPESFDEEIIGIDFGFTVPSAAVKIGFKENKIYTKTVLYEKGLTNPELIEKMQPYKSYLIYADSAEPDRIAEFRKAGFKIYPAVKDVTQQIICLKEKEWYICDQHTLNEVQDYRWKIGTNDSPVKENDHSINAIQYGVYTRKKKSGKTFFQSV